MFKSNPQLVTGCDHMDCKTEVIAWFEHALLIGGRHTSFVLMKCSRCGELTGFPPYNYRLVLEEGLPETLTDIKKVGQAYESRR